MERVQRLDFAGAVRGVVETPQGGRRMPAVLTRVGVLRYHDDTGREWGELRPPEEVFAPESLATLRAAPVVDLHPDVPVTTENFQALNLGHVHDDVAPEEERLVVGTVTVNAGAAVKKIDAGERKEVSCGYSMRPDRTPGVWQGEPYDVVQRDIRYNHVGIGPPGWGRAGEEVSLRLDGAAVQVRLDGAPKGNNVRVIKIKGREYKLDAEGEVVAAQGAVDDMTKKADADATELAAVKESLMNSLTLVAQLEAKLKAAEAAKPVVTEEMVPDEVADSLARKRNDLHLRARRVLGDTDEKGQPLKLDGLSVAEIHRRAVSKARPEIKLDGLSAETLAGMFLAVTTESTTSSARNDSLASAHRAAHGGDTHLRTDGADDDLDPASELARNTQNTFERRSRGDKESGR